MKLLTKLKDSMLNTILNLIFKSVEMKKGFLTLSLLLSLSLASQTQLKVMSYNLLDYPEALPNDRTPYLKNILDAIQPDILTVCELETEAAANTILNTALETADNRYAKGAFVVNTSGSYPGNLQQLAFYNSHKLTLTNQTEVKTSLRDINHFTFKLKTVNMATNPLYLEVYVAHLKSSSSYASWRADMIQDFTSALGSIPSNHFVLIGGDFNLYKNTEAAYVELLDPTNAIVLVDPINRAGNWHNNGSYDDIHTQSTHTSSFYFDGSNYYGAGGGLDDRFDFILMSQNLQTSTDLHYVSGTYKAYGNNGNCFNKNINDTSCTGTYSQTIRDNLYNMSDHLPVVMTLETPENTLAVKEQKRVQSVIFKKGNLVNNWLELILDTSLKGKKLTIYNNLGQVVCHKIITTTHALKYKVSYLKPGVYYIKIDSIKVIKPLKFIKLP